MHQPSTRSAEAALSKGLHGWIHSNRKAVLCAGDQLGRPATTLYQLSLCPIKKSGQDSPPFERGSKTPCAVSINSTLEVLWLYTKAQIKPAYFIQWGKKSKQIRLFMWCGLNHLWVFSPFQFLFLLIIIHSLWDCSTFSSFLRGKLNN